MFYAIVGVRNWDCLDAGPLHQQQHRVNPDMRQKSPVINSCFIK